MGLPLTASFWTYAGDVALYKNVGITLDVEEIAIVNKIVWVKSNMGRTVESKGPYTWHV